MIYLVDEEKCSGCGVGVEVCPTGAIQVTGGVAAIIQEKCTACGICFWACPSDAIYQVEDEMEPVAPLPPMARVLARRPLLHLSKRQRVASLVAFIPAALEVAEGIVRLFPKRSGKLFVSSGFSAGRSLTPQSQRRHRWRGGC